MAETKRYELTPEGRQRLIDELAFREGEKHDEIVERIKEARSFGDLSENSEYDAAKEEQSQNESRINEIRQILATAVTVEAGHSLTVSIGATVELKDEKGKTSTFTIVGTTETNSLEHKISNESPVGSALMGHEKGDVVEVVAPSGKARKYTITAITR
ncbi:transcription elongation factor GreA [Thermophilibacter sp.]